MGTLVKYNPQVGPITMASSELVWQCIRGGNSFMRKNLNGTVMSAEPGNLAGKHSYKHSGIANKANVGLTEENGAILLTKGKIKKSGKSKTVFKKDARRVMKGVTMRSPDTGATSLTLPSGGSLPSPRACA